MKTVQQIEALRAAGFHVHVSHLRRVRGVALGVTVTGAGVVSDRLGSADPLPELCTVDQARRSGLTVDPLGGYTTVEIKSADGETIASGRADCSVLDNFSRCRGLQIALGRAVKAGLGMLA